MSDIVSVNRRVEGLTEEERVRRARAAVKNFRAMQHTLTGFARALTGRKDVRVELDTGHPRTDGKRIFFRPPLELGNPSQHVRKLCEKRGPNARLLCDACRVREEVLVVIYHEISHIAFDSFAPTLEQHKLSMTQRAIEEWGSKYAEQIKIRIDSLPEWKRNDYKSMAEVISPYLPGIVNALEDARVNASMFRARAGIKVMMKAHVYGLLSEGVEQADGSVITWADQPTNAQAVVGCFVIGAGYDIDPDWLAPEVIEALADEQLIELCREAGESRRAADVYEISFKVLARLRELGFCKLPEEELEESEPEQEEEQEQDEADDSSDSDSDGDADDSSDERSDVRDAQEETDSEEESYEGGSSGDSESEEDSGGESEGEDADSESTGPGQDTGQDTDTDTSTEAPEEVDDETTDSSREAGDSDSDSASEEEDQETEEGEGSTDQPSEESDETREYGGGDGADQPEQSDTTEGEGEPDEASDLEAEQDGSDNGGGVGDEHESGDAAEEGGVSDSNEIPSETPGAGEAGEDSEDADGSRPSEDEGSVGESDSEEDGSLDTQEAGHGNPGLGGEDSDSSERDEREHDSGESTGLEQVPESEEEASIVEEDSDPFDMGGDGGKGGVEVSERPEGWGDPNEVESALKLIENHDEPPKSAQPDVDAANEALDQAIIQGVYFETPSHNLWGVRVHREGAPGLNDLGKPVDNAWNHARMIDAGISPREAGVECDLDVPESIMGKALLHTRRVFEENRASVYQNNLRSGRVNSRVLGRRAWQDDDRLFGKKRVPGKRDYFVLIGVDVSGSTVGTNLALAKRAAMAQAELCHRAGVQFAIYAHTFNNRAGEPFESNDATLDIYEIKSAEEPWDTQRQSRLARLGPDGGNLDGHTLEFYRKRLDEVEATDKMILYYTDGRMPASNYDEELEILQREIRTCKAKGYTLLGVGIRTDSPIRHGLDTVRVDNDENLKDVVMHLEKRLAR